jgi:hypothetical protein
VQGIAENLRNRLPIAQICGGPHGAASGRRPWSFLRPAFANESTGHIVGAAAKKGAIFRLCIGNSSYPEANVHPQAWIRMAPAAALSVMLGFSGGCHKKPAPVATPADVAAAQQEAQREVDQAQIEARKDVKSAVKIMGVDSKDVARAKITGAFDIAMAHADGDHKVAIEKCMALEPSAQPPCKDKAEIDYQSAVAKAKAIRVSQQQ